MLHIISRDRLLSVPLQIGAWFSGSEFEVPDDRNIDNLPWDNVAA